MPSEERHEKQETRVSKPKRSDGNQETRADKTYLTCIGLTDESSAFRRGDAFCVETETFDMRMRRDAG